MSPASTVVENGPVSVIGSGSSVMCSMPTFRSQDNVVGRLDRKSRDTWLSLIMASNVWPPAVMMTAVSRPDVCVVADELVDGVEDEEGAVVEGEGATEPSDTSA